MALLSKCIERKSSDCLYITCVYLLNNDTNTLEDEWINISSYIGKSKNLVFGKLWCIVNNELHNLLIADKYNVQDALIMTSKLYLLVSRIQNSIDIKNVNMKKLRSEIIEYFPDTAALNYEGLKLYNSILPPPQNEHFLFYSRILASFSKLFELHINKGEDKEDIIRDALEYITRKKNDMPLPNIIPLDTINNKIYGHNDPVWFLWGLLLCYFNDEKIKINFELYKWNYKKTSRLSRIGLLWGISYIFKNNLTFSWTIEEQNILQQVKNIAPELWKNIKEELQEEKEEENQHFILNSFMPRKSNINNQEQNSNIKNEKLSKIMIL